MTGPGEGKIPLLARIYIAGRSRRIRIDADVYLHVKGYSLARVTHIDIEDKVLENIGNTYAKLMADGGKLRIIFLKPRFIKELEAYVRELIIESNDLKPLDSIKSWVFVGRKSGGIFIGFRKNVLQILEKIAITKGYRPL